MNREQAERGMNLAIETNDLGPGQIFHLVCTDCGDYFGLASFMNPKSWCQKCIARYLREDFETDE